MLEKIQRFTLTGKDWGNVPVLRPVPAETDAWGVLGVLRGTFFEDLVPVVTGEVWSHALNGHLTPLMRMIGRPPEALLRLIPTQFRRCASWQGCGSYDPVRCLPGKKTPDCWSMPLLAGDAAEGITLAALETVLAWRDGRYVVIVVGDEFI